MNIRLNISGPHLLHIASFDKKFTFYLIHLGGINIVVLCCQSNNSKICSFFFCNFESALNFFYQMKNLTCHFKKTPGFHVIIIFCGRSYATIMKSKTTDLCDGNLIKTT